MYDAKLLREILDTQRDLVCRFRSDGTILFVNRSYADTLGRTLQDLTGANLWAFVSAEDRASVEADLRQITPQRPDVVIENRIETPEGPRWTRWHNRGLEWDEAGNLLVAQSTGQDVTERRQLEEQRLLLIDELNHRVRNTLTVVQGLAHQTFRGSTVPEELLAAFTARLHALAGAHAALTRANWTGAQVAEIVREGLAICCEDPTRVAMVGPPTLLRPSAAVALALVLHELATNAVKYGALANHAGQVGVEWSLPGDDRLAVVWTERGGPAVDQPTRTGFGSRLIESSIKRQLGGEVNLDFLPEGLTCRMVFPLRSHGGSSGSGLPVAGARGDTA